MSIQKYLLLLATCASINTFAQNSNFNTAVYFESGQSNISPKDSAILEQFLTRLTAINDYEISILAYTDDIGTDKANQLLAANRSEAVLNFLRVKNIPAPTRQTVQPVGEIALSSQKNIEKLRRKNRRVDINISVFAPQTMSDLFSYFNQRNKTIFECKAKDTVLLGQKGSMLSIPNDAFVLVDNKGIKIKYPIQIELREAYSFGDMLSNNVSTISNGQLIQTGGMLYVGAKDANGQGLKLGEGKQIEIGMPAKGVLKKDMQLFTADRAANDNLSNTDWQPQNKKFAQVNLSNTNVGSVRIFEQFYFNADLSEDLLTKWDSRVLKPLVIDAKFPDSVRFQQPNEPLKPKLVEVKAVQPTVELVKNQFKIQKKEKATDYEARILVQLENQTKNYERKLNERKVRQQEYKTATQKYEAAMLVYQQETEVFTKNRRLVKEYFNKLMEGGKESVYYQFFNQHIYYQQGVKEIEARISLKSKELSQIDNLLVTCQKYELKEIAKELNELRNYCQNKLKKPTGWYKAHLEARKMLADLAKIIGFDKGIFFEHSKLNSKERSYHYFLAKNENNSWEKQFDFSTIEKENEFLKFADSFYKNTLSKCTAENHQQLPNYAEMVNKLMLLPADTAEWEQIKQLSKKIKDILTAKETAEAKNNLAKMNDIKANDLNNLSQNLSTISGLGWVNCDRFYESQNLTHTNILVQANGEDKCFMVFTELDMIVPMELQPDGLGFRTPSSYRGVPKNAKVKIIGLRAKNGQVQTFVVEDLVQNVLNQKPTFKNSKVSELIVLFEQI
jgi:OmpA family